MKIILRHRGSDKAAELEKQRLRPRTDEGMAFPLL
jgi:hypothetical protein